MQDHKKMQLSKWGMRRACTKKKCSDVFRALNLGRSVLAAGFVEGSTAPSVD